MKWFLKIYHSNNCHNVIPLSRHPEVIRSLSKCGRRSSVQLPAFTLFESVVAVSVITVLLLISSMIYANIIDAEKPIPYYQARQEVDKIFQDTKSSQAFFTKNYSFENYDIEQVVEPYKGNKKLVQIDYTVKNGTKTWWTEHHLVANKQNVQ